MPNEKLEIKIWPPNKIKYAYLRSNYFADVGNLGKSCMRKREMQRALNFYVRNNVRIVVIVDDKNKIHGRAILWDNVKSTKLKKPFTYLDRAYANSNTLYSLFYNLAKENKWKRYPSTIVNQMNMNYYKEDIIIDGMCHLPYMDTFRYLYPADSFLAAGTNIMGAPSYYIIINRYTNSGYYPELDPDRVRESITKNYISKKDAIYVKRYNGWVLKEHIANINGDYYSTYDNETIKGWNNKWMLVKNSIAEVFTNYIIDKNEAIEITKYNGWVHKSNIIKIKDKLYHKQDKEIVCYKNKWYHISNCFMNYDRENRNKELSKRQYHFWTNEEIFVPHPDNSITYKGDLIPKVLAIIAYNLFYSPILNDIEYQEVYCTDKNKLLRLITGEFILNTLENKQHLKKFNNKWYIKKKFEPPNINQLQFSFMDK